MSLKAKKWTLLLTACAGVLALAAVAWIRHQTLLHADQLLRTIQVLHPGQTTYTEALSVVGDYDGPIQRSSGCNSDHCRIELRVDNSLLSRIHVASWTSLAASIEIEANRVSNVGTSYKTDRGDGRWFGILVSEWSCYPCFEGQEPFAVVFEKDNFGKPAKAMISLTTASKPVQRQHSYSLNLGCLTTFRGCADYREMLSTDWPK